MPSQTAELARLAIQKLEYYTDIKFEEETETAVYFTAVDGTRTKVQIRVMIDDELFYDDWSIWESIDGMDWNPVD